MNPMSFPSLCAQGVVTVVSKTDQTPRTIMNRHETYDGQILFGFAGKLQSLTQP